MRRREEETGGETAGEPSGSLDVFSDWDNPEDEREGPEGYDLDDDSYVPGPDDPDYDLSEAAGYAGWEEPRGGLFPRWLLVAISILLVLAIVTPLLFRIS